jgi:hypothetical protein
MGMQTKGYIATALIGICALALIASVALSASSSAAASGGQGAPKASQAPAKSPVVRKTAPPLPVLGYAPVRPMDIVRATYDFAAQHPEVLRFVPCYCGCGTEGHSSNESCFIARRDAKGNVLEWDTHGFGCTICVDVAREAMQLYSSGADVQSIRAAIEKKWTPGHPGTKTPTPFPPKK